MGKLTGSLTGFELRLDIPVSLKACLTLTHWTIQTVNALPTVFTGVVSAVRPQLAPGFKKVNLSNSKKYKKHLFAVQKICIQCCTLCSCRIYYVVK